MEGNNLKVTGLDAFNGSPVLDIKHYSGIDVEDMPHWVSELRKKLR